MTPGWVFTPPDPSGLSMVEVEIRKPLFDNFVYIRDVYLNRAKREGVPIKIKIPEGAYKGEYVTSYEEFMKGAKKMEKVFNIPNKPMVLWGNYAKNQENIR